MSFLNYARHSSGQADSFTVVGGDMARRSARLAKSMLPWCLLLASAAANAGGPYALHAPIGTGTPESSALLGFSISAARTAGAKTVVAGALGMHVGVYQFAAQGGALQLQQTLLSDAWDDNFAIAVAVSSASSEWIAIGSNGDDRMAFNAGRVDLYALTAPGQHTLVTRLLPPYPVSTGNFGSAVALDGDLLAVGEPKAARLSDNAQIGAVHLYRAVAGSWELQATLFGDQVGGRFGQTVAVHGGTVVVGSPLFDDIDGGIADVGALQFFAASGEHWVSQGTVMAAGRASGDRLGISVNIDGDNAIGGAANGDKPIGADAGTAYVFVRQGDSWTQQAQLRSSDPQVQERFGQSVSLNGDEAMVGAYCLNAGCAGPGAVYIFHRIGSSWTVDQRIAPPSTDAENFGHASSYASDGRAVVGAFAADMDGMIDEGAVYSLSTLSDQIWHNNFE